MQAHWARALASRSFSRLSSTTSLTVLRGGVLQQCDTPEKLFREPVNLFVAGLRGLNPLDRKIIRLHYWDEFTLAQIAQHLEQPEGTIRSRHHRARQRLRDLLSA